MVTDIAACASQLTADDWQKVQSRAIATRTVRILNLGLLLAKELSDAVLPPEIAARAWIDASGLAQQATSSLMHG
jgi:hypothetical protein